MNSIWLRNNFDTYNTVSNVQKNKLNNNSYNPYFKGNVVQVGKNVTNNTTKNAVKIGLFVSIASFFTGIVSQIEAKKAQKERDALIASTADELSKMTYAVPEIFGQYPNEYPAYAHYYRYSKAECDGIAEFVGDTTVFNALKNVLNPGTHREVPTRRLTKDEVIELGNVIKKYGEGLITDFKYNYSNHGDPLICNKGAELLNRWESGESLENIIETDLAKQKQLFMDTKNEAEKKFGIEITEVFAEEHPYKGDCDSVSYIHDGKKYKCYLPSPFGGRTEMGVLEALMKKYKGVEEFRSAPIFDDIRKTINF